MVLKLLTQLLVSISISFNFSSSNPYHIKMAPLPQADPRIFCDILFVDSMGGSFPALAQPFRIAISICKYPDSMGYHFSPQGIRGPVFSRVSVLRIRILTRKYCRILIEAVRLPCSNQSASGGETCGWYIFEGVVTFCIENFPH
ncbi:hypothetical protein GGTG_00425 [Gaeumannomyces tritici R3-111a-1]|uniref:Uncharacterized protein n=1 Tax=Gaeumannomyces tritici (strain R3-111a-1) TaxID=644352 RepID=J3NGN6_GAET3|nr:hypothetical protein GGTG_00425 [Gaeumannomyces tritici R3-111a-1]EJT80426.1 hypothetical protein GGTG_00425 [Gaeumannomyces tritici R3-111a-1]